MDISQSLTITLEIEGFLTLLQNEAADSPKAHLLRELLRSRLSSLEKALAFNEIPKVDTPLDNINPAPAVAPMESKNTPIVTDKQPEEIPFENDEKPLEKEEKQADQEVDNPFDKPSEDSDDNPGNDEIGDDEEIEEAEIADSAYFEEEEDADVNSSDGSTDGEIFITIEDDDREKENNENQADEFVTDDHKAEVTTREVGAAPTLNQSAFVSASDRRLRNAFTLNDKFRFRRELFGNSDREFSDAIDLIEAMKSCDEADEYFYGQLAWDPDNEEVRDFMNIVHSFLPAK